MGDQMNWLVRIMAWRWKQPAVARWLAVFALYAVALVARLILGKLYGGTPSLTFYPVILVAALVFGWKEAAVVLGLSVIAGLYLFLPSGMYLLPVGWVLVAGLTIAIVGGLRTVAQQLADANERQRILFQELQHRVANTLQSVVGTLDQARRRIDRAPDEAKTILDDGMRRILASADVHRRLNDPTLFEQGLDSILPHAVATVIDGNSINVSFEIAPLDLTFDQMSLVTMLVIEFANNAQKHVFERHLGRNFRVVLKALPDDDAMVSVTDDGPGWAQSDPGDDQRTLGQTIIQALSDQLGGTLSVESGKGTEISVVFPTPFRSRASATDHGRREIPAIDTA